MINLVQRVQGAGTPEVEVPPLTRLSVLFYFIIFCGGSPEANWWPHLHEACEELLPSIIFRAGWYEMKPRPPFCAGRCLVVVWPHKKD